MNFASDNTAGVAAPILEAIAEASADFAGSYGGDRWTAALSARMAEVFEADVAVFPVVSGTAANILSMAAIARPWSGILCSHDAHIMTDECGGAEMLTGGAKLYGIDGRNAKIDVDVLSRRLETWPGGVPHHVQPAAISITQASEYGAVWTPEEVGAIGAVVRRHGLRLHMDGARFANAVAALGCAPADVTWRAGVDILSFGATKNGAMAAEAVIVFDRALADSLPFLRMRTGHLLSKSRFLAAQLLAYLDGGLWLELARHANRMAARLAAAIEATPAARLAAPVEANEVFAYLSASTDRALKAAGCAYHHWTSGIPDAANPPREGEVLCRFVASFQTSDAEVGRFAEIVGAG
ncbi:L-threonine aldolase [Tepidamorphus gemmatus]|uniref:L-threonine aldolase n=1 Tax=Tepidamorphus gemmatus TaxID=747076 RepID=A0A4R3MMQ6_9HYPH|nr:beta-eliminating lyase-related protein [Tepidamorphus gemmatus]TCT13276.1 L-threonine aldolase [Tepidamorphus gemmatus]